MNEIVIDSSSLHDIELYLLTHAVISKDYRVIVEWLISKKLKSIEEMREEKEQQFLQLKREVIRKLKYFDECARSYRMMPESESLKRMVAAKSDIVRQATKILNESIDKKQERKIKRQLKSTYLTSLKKHIHNTNLVFDTNCVEKETADIYAGKLVNQEFMLEETVRVLKDEYDTRIMETRKRLDEYVVPHSRKLSEANESFKEVSIKLAELEQDQLLSDIDKEQFRNAFESKAAELRNIMEIESERIESVRFLAENLREGFKNFENLITLLSERLQGYRKRQDYLETLDRLGKTVPLLKSVLDDLFATFEQNVADIKKGFLFSDVGLQKKIINAIDEQCLINKIIINSDEDGDIIEIEKSVMADVSAMPEVDLEFLQPFTDSQK